MPPKAGQKVEVQYQGLPDNPSVSGRASSEAADMAVREILKMGDPRLLRVAAAGDASSTRRSCMALVADMFDTMDAANGAGLAAPQIGVDLQLVIFGFERNERYPDAPPVPHTVLINPVIDAAGRRDGRRLGGLPVGARAARRGAAPARIRYRGFDPQGQRDRARGRRLPCPRGAARVRPPDRPPVPHAHDAT